MYYPPLFTSVRPFDPRANPLDVPVATRENPLDLSVKTIRQTPDSTGDTTEDLLMLDHRKLASLAAASHSLSSVMSRQLGAGAALLDPSALFRLGYAPDGTPLAAMIPGLAPPFCYDRASGVAVPTSLAGHQLMSSFLQQQQQRERCLEQQALFAARTSAQQQAAVAAAFMDPAMHLRNGMSQREAAAALAATRGLYAPAMPTPMVLPAFSLYTEDKGAFTSLRTSSGDKSFLNGSGLNSTALETARFAEHLQRLREQHLQQHPSGKCSNACCTSLTGMPQTSVPCACCVQSPPSQSALCARSPMGSSTKDPTTAATGKACDFLQPSLSFLHRPAVTTATPPSSGNTSDLRLSVSSLCTTVANTETTTTSSRDKMSSVFSSSGIWNAGLPSVSTSGKTAFSVPKKKEVFKDSSCHNKETKPSANIKDILKDSNVSFESRKYDAPITTKPYVPIKTENLKKEDSRHLKEEHSKYYKNTTSSHDVKPFAFPKHSSKSNGHLYNGNDALTTVTSVTPIVPTKCEGGTIPIARMPPLLEAVRPTDHLSFREHFQDSSVVNPQGPPPLIAATNGEASSSASSKSAKIPYISTTTSNPFLGQAVPAFKNPGESKSKSSESSKSKSSKKSSSQPIPKFGALPPGFIKEEPMLPKPIPHLPPPIYPSHYRPGQHQMSLQTHNGWIPPAHPNVTVAPPSTTSSTSAPATISTTGAHPTAIKPELFFTSPTIKREPDYADTPNVLQSLLIRSAHGLDPLRPHSLAVAPTSIPTATSVITPLSAPLFGLDYRYHFGHQLGLPKPDATSYCPPAGVSQPKDKPDIVKSESSKSSKKRTNGLVNGQSHSDESATKKRFIEYSSPLPRYSFQPSTFASEAAEAPECPYTFIAEPPLNYTGQPKLEAKERSAKLETPEKSRCHPTATEEITKMEDISDKCQKKSQKPTVKSSTFHEYYRISDRARARSKLRKRLLARIYQQRRPLARGVPDKSQIDKEIGLQHTRKLLSQISLRWSHRRYLYKWYAARRKAVESARRKRKCDVYKVKNERLAKKQDAADAEGSVAKANSNASAIPIPSEMKRLMVNKAVGETILHRASRLGYPEVVAYCLQKFAGNVNTRNNAGFTPLHECCSKGHLDIARALLQYGADVNASAAGGIRPLHDAVENDHVEVVRLLLSYGADPTIATYSGLEPLKLARSPFMAEFLQGFLADISGEVDSRPHLPWRFWGSVSCLDPEETGCDVFDGVPPDPEEEGEGDNDFLFEVSDSPHLPTFRLAATSKAQCNYLRLSDVLSKLGISKEDFVSRHEHVEVLSLPKHEFEASATCSQLLTGTKMDEPSPGSRTVPDRFLDSGDTTDLVRLDHSIRNILGIETISVR